MEGRLYLEFMFDDMMRIKTWHFSIRQHREVLPRSILAMHVSVALQSTNRMHTFLQSSPVGHLVPQDPQMLDQLAKNITRCGLSNSTLNYLRVSGFRFQPVFKTSRVGALNSSCGCVVVSSSSFV